jgi:menaquinone reductase, molybdopterin-binding-like subunit
MDLSIKKLTELLAFNRRNFIKLLIGGAAGIHVTPLPWKLMDDVAIWTQNWPWLPVPPRGAFAHADTICTLCPGGCGISVRKVDERPVKIEGRADYPVNPGGICPLGSGGLQLLYTESLRFTGPMKRVGPRGAGDFVAISWEEALKTVADRLGTLKKQGMTEAVAALDGNRLHSSMSFLIRKFLDALGSPTYARMPSLEDTYTMVNRMMFGIEAPMAYDLEHADFVLSFGCGLIEGWGAPGRMLNAWSLWRSDPLKGKVKIVQVDFRASNTASKADQWIPAKPGTEAVLALGIAHVMLKDGLYDPTFVSNHTFGFADWTSPDGKSHVGFRNLVLRNYSPDVVSRITGTDAGQIVSLARAFAGARAPIALCGKGKGDLNGSLYECLAVQGLNALTGNINKPGGVLVYDDPSLHDPRPAKKTGSAAPLMAHQLGEAILEGKTPVEMLLLLAANPAHTLPDGGAFRKAFEKIPFVVSFSPFRDESSLLADLVLPDHTYLEKTDDVVRPVGLQYGFYGLTQPVLEPLYDTRNTGDVLVRLADMMGGRIAASLPWDNYEDLLKERTSRLFEAEEGLTRHDPSRPAWEALADHQGPKSDYRSADELWKKLKNGGFWYRPFHRYGHREDLFKTPSGKLQFCSDQIEKAAAGTVEPVENQKAYPLVMAPYGLINLASGWAPSPPYLYKTLFDHQVRNGDSFADIHPQTAGEYGLKQGDLVVIESSAGKIQARVNIFPGAMPGVVSVPFGFGHTGFSDFHHNKGANPNAVITGPKDPLSGMPAWWRTPVRISKPEA